MRIVSVAAVVVLLALVVIPTEAQMDLSKVLVGKWEGKFQTEDRDRRVKGRTVNVERTEHLRTLIIGQVREQDGKWIVGNVKFGETGKPLGAVIVTLEMAGGEANIQFITGAGNPVKLRLSKEDLLVGTISVSSISGSAFRPIEFKKAE